MINCSNLDNYINEYIKNNPTIIYIGVGTEFTNYENKDKWNYEDNQQLPSFLFDAKIKYMEYKLLIILIDPNISNPPYIINSTDSFLDNSWIKSNIYTNLFESSFGIDVICIKEFITWGFHKNYESEYYDIENMMINICKKISDTKINSLLFYHEFTGKNTIFLEYEIKKKFNYDDKKICIDITRGSNLSCYFILSNPENYPIIKVDNNNLIYNNPEYISEIEKKSIITQYKNFKINLDYFSIHNLNFNKISNNINEFILNCQIIKIDTISFDIIKNSIITLIRQFYTLSDDDLFYKKISVYNYTFPTLSFRFKFIKSNIDDINNNFNLINELNEEKETNNNYKEIFINIKKDILNQLFNLLEIILKNILYKYNLDNTIIENFIILLYNTDKFKLISNFEEFIKYNL